MYDVIIIGAGAAGITAAIYAARANLKFEIISKDVGGLTLWSPDIENYTGFHNLTGIDLVEKFKEHMKDNKINVKEESVIVCSGSSPRKLNIKGADKYEGKGLAYCATCDGPLFAGREVAVVGGGDSALAACLTLINIVDKIYILNLSEELTGNDKAMKDKVLNSGKVEVINNTKTTEVVGDDFVTGIKYEQNGEEKTLNIQGIFVEIGHIRNVDFVKDLVEVNDKNEIVVDKEMMSSTPGIFSAGDVNDIPGKQAIIAAGDGSKALLSAFRYISKK
jgi:thioredoxin reductase